MGIPTDTTRGAASGGEGMRADSHVHDRLLHPMQPAPSGGGQSRSRQRLRLGFFLTVGILLVEVVSGVSAHSLALLSDAGHVLTDVAALGLAWFAAAQAERPPNARRTFGYHRVGILTALANAVTLVVIAVVIGFEAYRRFQQPQPVHPGLMAGAAAVAIGVNLFIALRLRGEGSHNLNVRAAALHIMSDIGASLGVIAGAVAIALTGAYWVDPLVSLLIAVLIAVGAVRIIAETVNILLEATPRGVSLPDLVRDMLRVPGVHDVHDLHVWTISSGMQALSCHLVIDDLPPSDSAPILDRISAMLRQRYHITHTTIQFESTAHGSHEGFCACPPGYCEGLYCDLSTHAVRGEHSGHTHHHHN
jgi:cobalt-zinc-cadmium efflux system protein